MKLQYILTAVNEVDEYQNIIPYFIKFTKLVFKDTITQPIVILVQDEIPDRLKEYKENIILFKPIPGVCTRFQACCIRLLFPAMMETDDAVMITDSDMLPFNKEWYENLCKDQDPNKFQLNLRQGITLIEEDEYPFHYHTASPKVWGQVFDIQSIDDVKLTLQKWWDNNIYTTNPPKGATWMQLYFYDNHDQKMLYEYVNNFKNTCTTLNKTDLVRMDRIRHTTEDFRNNVSKFTDFHCFRCYSHGPRFLDYNQEIYQILIDHLEKN